MDRALQWRTECDKPWQVTGEQNLNFLGRCGVTASWTDLSGGLCWLLL